jgi:hypothetical protein
LIEAPNQFIEGNHARGILSFLTHGGRFILRSSPDDHFTVTRTHDVTLHHLLAALFDLSGRVVVDLIDNSARTFNLHGFSLPFLALQFLVDLIMNCLCMLKSVSTRRAFLAPMGILNENVQVASEPLGLLTC